MSESYIIINGKRIDFTPEQIKLIRDDLDCKDDDRFERKIGEEYFASNMMSEIHNYTDYGDETDDKLYAIANYFKDEEYAKQVMLRETLNRLLLRYSDQHGGDSEWDGRNYHYCIDLHQMTAPSIEWFFSVKPFGAVFFAEKKVAGNAIKGIVEPFLAEHPEFKG